MGSFVAPAREWFAALDYGFTGYTVVLLGCTDGDGNVFVVDGHAERLGEPAAGIAPRSLIPERCGRLAETLPALNHDPNRPEDVPKVDADEHGVGGEDAADALRYRMATTARTVVRRKLRGCDVLAQERRAAEPG